MGVLQIVEARKRGYPRRYAHRAFDARFRSLVHDDDDCRVVGDDPELLDPEGLAFALCAELVNP